MRPTHYRHFVKHGTLPQLAAFEAIVRLGSFTRAAEEMHLAQPTVSGLVRKLADSAGATLFEKVGRHAVPTAAGRTLYAAAGELLGALARAETELAALRDTRTCGAMPHAGCDRPVYSSRARFSLGAGASSETRKNGIRNRRVRAPRNLPLPQSAGHPPASTVHDSLRHAGKHTAPRSFWHMDATLDYSLLVFAKTPKGVAEINARSGALTLPARRVLIMIDGHRPVAELMAVVRTGEFEGIMSTLESQGMIEKVEVSALPHRDYEAEDFADTISLLQENAAALRALPQVNPATLAPQAQPRPAASAAPATEPEAPAFAANDAAAIAARAVATASAPRTTEQPMRRPPTVGVPAPVTTRDMAVGTARPGTINVALRTPDPVRRPPTLSGVRHAPVNEPAAAVEAPARPAAAPAPAPTAVVVPKSLEEEKRHAVSELYSVLGPYGEQPAAKLQECTTIEALREQIKQAGRRVATFRGEKAAQDYLRALGHA